MSSQPQFECEPDAHLLKLDINARCRHLRLAVDDDVPRPRNGTERPAAAGDVEIDRVLAPRKEWLVHRSRKRCRVAKCRVAVDVEQQAARPGPEPLLNHEPLIDDECVEAQCRRDRW